MKKLIFTLSLLVPIFIIGCTGSIAEYEIPKDRIIEKERVINSSFDIVWQKTIDWFASHNTPIKTLDKSSGIIASDYDLSTTQGLYIDCGKALHGAENGFGVEVTHLRFENQRGNFNVSVKKIDDNSTNVSINFFSQSDLNQYNNSGQQVYSQKVTCKSNGKLEKEILDSISK
jgi:hypothetical protein